MPTPLFNLAKNRIEKQAGSDDTTEINPSPHLESGGLGVMSKSFSTSTPGTRYLWVFNPDLSVESVSGYETHQSMWGRGCSKCVRGIYDPKSRLLTIMRSKSPVSNAKAPVTPEMKQALLERFKDIQAVKLMVG